MFVEPMENKKAEQANSNDIIMHVDFDKKTFIFYNNIYFKEHDHVLKMPLTKISHEISYDDVIVEKFNLTKYVYLLHY